MARNLWASLEPAQAIRELLDRAFDRGALTPADFDILIADLQRITTEETPTDRRVGTDVPKKSDSVSREPSAARAAEPGLGSVLKGRYQLEELVADGPMGKVFRAADRLKQRAGAIPAVAIKMLNPNLRFDADATAQLQQEAFQVQRLTHPNIINIFDFDTEDATDFITMEWLEGESLASLLDRNGSHPLKMSEVNRIVTGVAAGLAYAHVRGIVHGDIKPANIYLCRDGLIKIMDFGLVRGPAVVARSDGAAAFAVTPGYASCALLEGNEPCVQDDVYALACTIYRMVAGYRPHGRQTALQAESGSRALKRPRGLTRDQWHSLRAGLAFRRRDRLADVRALLQAFSESPNSAGRTGWAVPAIIALIIGLFAGVAARYAFDEFEPAALRQSKPAGLDVPVVSGLPGAASQAPVEDAVVLETTEQGLVAQDIDRPSIDQERIERERVTPDESAGAQSVIVDLRDAGDETDLASIDESPVLDVVDEPAVRLKTGFQGDRFEVREGDGFVRLIVRVPPDQAVDQELRFFVESGAATALQDFVRPSGDRLEFSPGETEKTILIPLIADAIGEYVEDFSVRLESARPDFVLDNSVALIVITDDDE